MFFSLGNTPTNLTYSLSQESLCKRIRKNHVKNRYSFIYNIFGDLTLMWEAHWRILLKGFEQLTNLNQALAGDKAPLEHLARLGQAP
ncbi:hypothetical protein EUGRSUZ_C01275 [Eucalyptus grandis]|uniref:Uncharacterized protein n=2 Tax=Eucalyptus grandis TaxID=71139 RepID=A0ACC3LBM1_EUCGR|nr:hypothetical protein EUGRSUZ_C01275 [Eucalyptus grandis]